MRRLLGLVFAALAATMLLALSAGQALATTVHCGDTITQDTTLTSDVICPSPNDGAINLASDEDHDNPFEPDLDVDPPNPPPIHLDLNGHTVVGSVSGGNRFFPLDVDVEVGNGTVYGEVRLGWATSISVHDLTVHGARIEVDATPAAQVLRNSVTNSRDFGIVVVHTRVDARDNVVRHSGVDGPASGILGEQVSGLIANNVSSQNVGSGIFVTLSRDLRIEGNATDRNLVGFPSLPGNGVNGDGIEVPQASTRAIAVTSNHAWFNGNLGVEAHAETLGGGNWAKHNGNPLQCVPGSLCSTTGKPKVQK